MVRSAKKPRDENAPKRPLSAYFMWTGENRDSYKTKNPDKSVTEIMKGMAKAWNNLSDAGKKPYLAAAAKAGEAYQKKRDKYVGSANFKRHQEAVAEWKKNDAKKPFGKDPNRPKKGTSAYLLFVNSERPALMKSGLSITEVTTAASKKWNNMGESEKAKWVKKGAAAKAKADKEIAAYEKTASYKKYLKEKEEYNQKRSRSASASAGPAKKKAKNASKSRSKSARVPKAAKKSKSRSVSRKRAA